MSSPTAGGHTLGSLRKINEDTGLRPFLSPLFDAQSYIKSVIKEGKSEECFTNIVKCVDDINIDIKGYISQHKDELMSGMQDVAALADRYSNLSAKSQKLHRNIQRLKSEASESHDVVTNKTTEIECIHTTSSLLHQLKLFVHEKKALDTFMKNANETDLRNLSGAAKTISELEKLLLNPGLLELKMVSDYSADVKNVGRNVRALAQERLLTAISEKNQAAMASTLQVFYNLDSLPEILLLVVDVTVKKAVEQSRGALDVEGVHALLVADYVGSGSTTVGGVAGLVAGASVGQAPMSATKKQGTGASTTAGAGAGGNASQVRSAIREVAHTWSSNVHDVALQIHALQRVVAKKEDPSTHERFLSALHRLPKPISAGTNAYITTSLLSKGLLLDLFWHRLGEALQEVSSEKVKHFGAACSRTYPNLRKAALGILTSLDAFSGNNSQEEESSHLLHNQGFLADPFSTLLHKENNMNATGDFFGESSPMSVGLFGSQLFSQDDLLATASMHFSPKGSTIGACPINRHTGRGGVDTSVSNGSNNEDIGEVKEHNLVLGLRPMRDKYLILALQRMSAPIAQMFPELEGYTAAVPSKRDMLALTKAIQAEFLTVFMEGDASLVALLCKEFLKTVKLMLSKIEGMIAHTADTRTLVPSNNFARSQSQTHNANLLVLLVQLKEALLKIPDQVLSSSEDASASLLAASKGFNTAGKGASTSENGSSSNSEAFKASVYLERAVRSTCGWIEELAGREIMNPIAALVSAYVTSVVATLHKEGTLALTPATPSSASASSSTSATSSHPAAATATPTATTGGGYTGKAPIQTSTPIDASVLDCSLAVQTLLKQLPNLLKTHILSLPKCDAVGVATEEVYVRTLHSYVTVAALVRPVTEASRLRTAKDLTALEMMLSGIFSLPQPNSCPVLREYKAFRRLIFEFTDRNTPDAGISTTPSKQPTAAARFISPAPDPKDILRLTYLDHLRPSTVLGYLLSCAPPLLPAPFDAMDYPTSSTSPSENYMRYVDMLTDVSTSPAAAADGVGGGTSVRYLYATNMYHWRDIPNETNAWQLTQRALDLFFQRISVAEGEHKQLMRKWYESILEVGSSML